MLLVPTTRHRSHLPRWSSAASNTSGSRLSPNQTTWGLSSPPQLWHLGNSESGILSLTASGSGNPLPENIDCITMISCIMNTSERLHNRRVGVDSDSFTPGASHFEQVSMKLEDVVWPSSPVQTINVLSDDHNLSALSGEPPLNISDGCVSRVGMLGAHHLPPVVVELPDQGGVGVECLGCGQLLSLVSPPVSSSSSEGGDTWLCTHPSPGQYDQVLTPRQDLSEPGQVWGGSRLSWSWWHFQESPCWLSAVVPGYESWNW